MRTAQISFLRFEKEEEEEDNDTDGKKKLKRWEEEEEDRGVKTREGRGGRCDRKWMKENNDRKGEKVVKEIGRG